MTADDLKRAHRHAGGHRAELMASDVCGCFYCLAIFPPTAIAGWIGTVDGDTARCPECVIDSVIGSDSGFPITDEFLKAMQRHWFNID